MNIMKTLIKAAWTLSHKSKAKEKERVRAMALASKKNSTAKDVNQPVPAITATNHKTQKPLNPITESVSENAGNEKVSSESNNQSISNAASTCKPVEAAPIHIQVAL